MFRRIFVRKDKAAGHHSHHNKWLAAHLDCLSQNRRITAKHPAPCTVAEDDGTRIGSPRTTLLPCAKIAPYLRRHPQHFKQVGTNIEPADLFRALTPFKEVTAHP